MNNIKKLKSGDIIGIFSP